MWRPTLAIVAVIWVNTVLVSAQSSGAGLYRLLELMRVRAAFPGTEQDRPTVTIPRTWDDQAVASLQVPLAVADASPVQIPSTYYYGIPVRPIYESYAVYHPGKEPAGYIEWLTRQEPQIVVDATRLRTEADWIAAGELVFDAPIAYGHIAAFGADLYLRDPKWYEETGAPLGTCRTKNAQSRLCRSSLYRPESTFAGSAGARVGIHAAGRRSLHIRRARRFCRH